MRYRRRCRILLSVWLSFSQWGLICGARKLVWFFGGWYPSVTN